MKQKVSQVVYKTPSKRSVEIYNKYLRETLGFHPNLPEAQCLQRHRLGLKPTPSRLKSRLKTGGFLFAECFGLIYFTAIRPIFG